MSQATKAANADNDGSEECLALLTPSPNLQDEVEKSAISGSTPTTDYGRRVSFHTHSQRTTTITDLSEETTPREEFSNAAFHAAATKDSSSSTSTSTAILHEFSSTLNLEEGKSDVDGSAISFNVNVTSLSSSESENVGSANDDVDTTQLAQDEEPCAGLQYDPSQKCGEKKEQSIPYSSVDGHPNQNENHPNPEKPLVSSAESAIVQAEEESRRSPTSMEEKKDGDECVPVSHQIPHLRPSLRHSRSTNSLAQSWQLGDNPEEQIAVRNILPATKQMPRLRSSFRQSRRTNSLSQSWNSQSLESQNDQIDATKVSKREEFKLKKRPSLKKQASSFSLRRPSISMQSFRLARGSQMDLLQIVDDEKEHPSRKRFHWWHAVFLFSGVSLLICLLQLFLPPPFGALMTSEEIAEGGIAPGCEDGLERCICPRETICATDRLSIILLTLARSSVFFDYPLYMMMFLSKAHNLNNHIRRTLLREWVDFGDMHKVHKIFGTVVGIETMFHSFFHLLRWGLNNEASLSWQTATGVTGLIAAVVTPLICWPMSIPYLKQRISFEARKGLHYLFVVWAVALLYHAPSRIPFLIGIPALVYAADYIFGYLKRNNLVEAAHFERYGENGVAVHFKNPKSWEEKPPTSYVYIMCPWISKYQWHGFTVFPDQLKENHSMLCIGASGDWTKKLHEKIKVPCLRQLYVHGPFMSEFSDQAITTANAIAVAAGVGITPTLSLMMNYTARKRINIIWTCRDAGLIEYILHKIDIGKITKNSFAFIFYTGKRQLALPKKLPTNLFILKSRPDLENTITGIVTAIHSGEGLPEQLYEKQKMISNLPFRTRMMIAMSRVTQTYDENEMFEYAVKETERAAERMKDADLEAGRTDTDSDTDSDSDSEYSRLFRRSSTTSRSRPSVDIPENEVSMLGLDAMITRFLGVIGEYSYSDIKDIFDTIDRNKSGFIDRADFSFFLQMATGNNDVKQRKSSYLLSSMVELTDMEAALSTSMHNSYHGLSSTHTTASEAVVFGDSNTKDYVSKLMEDGVTNGERPLEDWSIFYCGGSNAIKKNLKDISKRYDIDLAVEKFDW